MTNEEAIKYLIAPFATSTKSYKIIPAKNKVTT